MENISFNSTVFFEFLDYMQSVRILSNLEPGKPVTIFLLFSVCLWSVFRAKRGLSKNNYSLEEHFKETTD